MSSLAAPKHSASQFEPLRAMAGRARALQARLAAVDARLAAIQVGDCCVAGQCRCKVMSSARVLLLSRRNAARTLSCIATQATGVGYHLVYTFSMQFSHTLMARMPLWPARGHGVFSTATDDCYDMQVKARANTVAASQHEWRLGDARMSVPVAMCIAVSAIECC